nr:MAG TPA: hypothetical protein [Caudoviricetes sp.]
MCPPFIITRPVPPGVSCAGLPFLYNTPYFTLEICAIIIKLCAILC